MFYYFVLLCSILPKIVYCCYSNCFIISLAFDL